MGQGGGLEQSSWTPAEHACAGLSAGCGAQISWFWSADLLACRSDVRHGWPAASAAPFHPLTCPLLTSFSPPAQDIKAKINGLQQAVMKIGSSLSGQGGSSEGGENVQDAEVKDKKE